MAEKNYKSKMNNFFNVISAVITIIAIITILFTVFSLFGGSENKKGIFGVKLFVIQTNSMSKKDCAVKSDVYFDAGDVVFIKNVNVESLVEGDVIAFISMNEESLGKIVVHKIRNANYNSVGELTGFVTYGVNKGVNDFSPVQPEYIIGKYAGKIPKIGVFFNFVKQPAGLVVCILLPFTMLVAVGCVKFGVKIGKENIK